MKRNLLIVGVVIIALALIVLVLLNMGSGNTAQSPATQTPPATAEPTAVPPTQTPPTNAPQPTANPVQNILWMWTSVTNQTTKDTTSVPDPENYTITFKADGTLEGKADCNSFTGSYSQVNGFSIQLGAMTKMYCGDDSLDQQYLQLLGSVAAGGTGWARQPGAGDGWRRAAYVVQEWRECPIKSVCTSRMT